jgi:ParB family chromosome partitioning protein
VIIDVPIDKIDPNPFQCRQDYGDIAALATDIDQRGLQQIPRGRLVTKDGFAIKGTSALDLNPNEMFKSYRVQLAFGHRRLRAYRYLDTMTSMRRPTMPVDVGYMTDTKMLDAVWSENQQRADFNPIEQAELLAAKVKQVKEAGVSSPQETVAKEWGIDRTTLANRIRLLKLPEGIQMRIRSGMISERKAMAMLSLNGNTAELETIVGQAEELSSDEIRKLARRGPKIRHLSADDEIPMLRHGEMPFTETDSTRRLKIAAKAACNRCIEIVGSPNDLVCKECPGVTLVKYLRK